MLYLFCHAFFKALLFLGAGSVIHGTERQDVRELGGLTAHMPITSRTFFIGAMCMAGVIPLSGFFAKDEILVAAVDYGLLPLVLLLLTLPITAMYMLRVYLLTFTGEARWLHVPAGSAQLADAAAHAGAADHEEPAHEDPAHHAAHEPHESPPIMSWPLLLLAALAVVAGFIVFDPVGEAIGLGSGFLGAVENALVPDLHHFEFDVPIAVLSTALVLLGLGVGMYAWSGEAEPAKKAAASFPFFYRLFRNKFYIDDFYQWCINYIVLGLAKVIAFFDRAVVNDTGVNGSGQLTSALGWVLKFQQTGKLPNYALAMILGVAVIAIVGFSVRG
jgi:NADH-quinone oxidoreductase subunit L